METITLFIYCSFAVWGGDPVYPTINYIQDPDEVIDYRGPDFHEPTPNMLAYLMEVECGLLLVFNKHNIVPRYFAALYILS